MGPLLVNTLINDAQGTIAKEVPKEGAILGGRSVPGGTWIGLNSFGMARITAIFGQDAEMFRPERWFEADEQRLQRMNETVHLVFGYGKYMCLGKGVAWMELNKAIVEVRLAGSCAEVLLLTTPLRPCFDSSCSL